MRPVKGLTPEEQRKLDEWLIEGTTKGLEHIDTVREAFACWRKRQRGGQLVGRESILADHFERLLPRLYSEEHYRAFVHQLWRTLQPDKITLLDAVGSVWRFNKSWEDIKKDVIANYGDRWKTSQWKRVKKVVSGWFGGPFSG